MNFKGQSLLEIVITLGLIIIVLAAVTANSVSGLKNSQFSQDQITATKYAQEGLEKVKTIRTRDYAVCIGTTDKRWSDIWDNSFGNQPSCGTCKFRLGYKDEAFPNGCTQDINNQPPASDFWLKQTTTEVEDIEGGKFKRIIIIENHSASPVQKKVTSRVTWDDPTGTHQSELVTIMAQY